MTEIVVNIKLRPHQLVVWNAWKRFSCVVMHRRAGKTFNAVCRLFESALTTNRKDWRGYYVGPSYRQAKAIAWDYLTQFVRDLPGININVSELRVDFPNGSRIQLLGVENSDSLRGRYADDVVADEAQLWPTSVFGYVLRPLLADRKGSILITGTPAGKHNLLGWAHEEWSRLAIEHPDEYYHQLLPYTETNALDKAELESMRRQMSQEAWLQEMECSFTASLQGAYYARQMEEMRKAGRITKVDYDQALPVFCALDLGFSDALAIWYGQMAGNTAQFFDYEEHHGMSLMQLADHWHAKPFPIHHVLLPHDARVRELGTGKSRLEQLQSRGVTCSVVNNIPIHDGIEASRVLLPRCYMDATRCMKGIEALQSYRAEMNEKRQVLHNKPLHDWASHGADAFRYFAVGQHLVTTGNWAPIQYRKAIA